MTEETTYYEGGQVRVTSARVVLGSKTYTLSNITSVSMRQKGLNVLPALIVFVLGIIVVACVALFGTDWWCWGTLLLVDALITALLFFAAFNMPRNVVRIGSASGETDALVLKDQERVKTIVDAINEAIVKRG